MVLAVDQKINDISEKVEMKVMGSSSSYGKSAVRILFGIYRYCIVSFNSC